MSVLREISKEREESEGRTRSAVRTRLLVPEASVMRLMIMSSEISFRLLPYSDTWCACKKAISSSRSDTRKERSSSLVPTYPDERGDVSFVSRSQSALDGLDLIANPQDLMAGQTTTKKKSKRSGGEV